MNTPPASPPPPLPPPPANADASPSTLKRTRKATRLRSLATRPPGAERPVVNVDPATGKADVDKDGADDIVCEKYGISKEKWTQFCQTRRDPSWEDVRKKAQASQKQNTAPHVLSRGGYEYLEEKLMAEKAKKRLEEAAQSGSTEGIIDPPSPIRRHVKWKMARTKKTGQMTSEAAKEIADRIVSHF
ncbi:arp2/3 complex-activating protein rickA-like [Glycine max]|uniref:arp2/3 complex-activating protein rickA-like n=1 Tax=Glycine max TaxID=3847 RepID=UPI001B35781C|nr:arp2/3 complex-activating protein rickA-like [Glycine max]